MIRKTERPNRLFPILSALFVFTAGVASATEIPGWSPDFVASTNLAETTSRPMILLWANKGCSHCEDLKTDLRGTEFQAWMDESCYLFCFVQGAKHKDPDGTTTVKDFARSAAGTKTNGPTSYPFVCLYWKRADGTLQVKSFSGSSGSSLMNSADSFFDGYDKPNIPYFQVSGADLDRYEALASTAYVDIRISRDPELALPAATNALSVVWPADIRAESKIPVVWANGESHAVVRVSLDRGTAAFPVGRSLALSLQDENGTELDRSAVFFVADVPNSPENPHWIGEFTPAELPWGEWTFDYGAALEKTKNEGHLIAVFSGVLWCPHCVGIDQSLFSPTNTEFYAWAKENKVALVLFDQPRFGEEGPRLLNDVPDPRKTGDAAVSGTAYLSRRMLDPDSDEVVSVRNLQAAKTVEWLAPETTASRLSNPTILLIGDGGTVKGRFTSREKEDRTFDSRENIARLNDFLLLDENGNERNGYLSTTNLRLTPGTAASVTLQISERTKCFLLNGVQPGYLQLAAAAPASAANAGLALEVVVDGHVIASGGESVLFKLNSTQISKGVGVRVTAYSDTAADICGGGVSSRFTCAVSLETVEVSGDGELDGPGFDPDGKPCFGWDNYEIDLYQHVESSFSFNLVNVDGAKSVKIKKVSGKLPSGLKISYDKETGRVVLTGRPKKAVQEPVELTYEVTASIDGEKVTGIPVTVVLNVKDPATVNPFLLAKRYCTIPLYSGDLLAGVLTFQQSTKNKVSVKYYGTKSKTVSDSGYWSSVDASSGEATVSLRKKDVEIDLTVDANGKIRARFAAPALYSHFAGPDRVELSGEANLSPEGFERFKGYYTVTLPARDGLTGTGYLILKFTSKSALSSGKVSYSGVMPEGWTVSGSAYLSLESVDRAVLPVFKRKSDSVFGATISIAADAGTGLTDTERSRAVTLSRGLPYQVKDIDMTPVTEMDVFGSWYPAKEYPFEICGMFGLGTRFALYAGAKRVATVEATKKLELSDVDGKARLSFTKSSGVFKGSVYVSPDGTGTVKGTVKGVLNPGWGDCGCGDGYEIRAFGEGTCYYTQKENGRSVKRSIPVYIIAEE